MSNFYANHPGFQGTGSSVHELPGFQAFHPRAIFHEGDVQIVEYADGVLKIRLTGHCSGCPSARLTTEELIAAEVQKEIPEVKEVVLVNEISPELLDFARKLLNHNHEAQECI